MRWRTRPAAILAILPLLAATAFAQARVQVVPDEAHRKVDVTVDGKPFTSYIWPIALKKPVLYPLRSAKGTVVTRGFPLDPHPGERADHPHHVGLWFNHGDVNGFDFWNNSDAIPAAQAPKMGTIVHQKVVEAKSGSGQGSLTVESEWKKPDGSTLLKERTEFVFRADGTSRTIDRVTTLTALGEKVVFNDNKEGVIGMRVARQLEQPDLKAEKFTDAAGRVTTVAAVDTTGVHGKYLSSEGKQGDDVWGTRGRWTMLTGDVAGAPVTLAILDHPKNVGYPTYWHARGYGLFAANPLGQKAMSNGKEELNFKLAPGKSVTFQHEVLILDGKASASDIEKYSASFAK